MKCISLFTKGNLLIFMLYFNSKMLFEVKSQLIKQSLERLYPFGSNFSCSTVHFNGQSKDVIFQFRNLLKLILLYDSFPFFFFLLNLSFSLSRFLLPFYGGVVVVLSEDKLAFCTMYILLKRKRVDYIANQSTIPNGHSVFNWIFYWTITNNPIKTKIECTLSNKKMFYFQF